MLRRKWCMMITGVFVAQFGKTRVLEKPLGSLGSDWCSWLAYFSTSPQIQISGETPDRIMGISMSWTFPWNHPVLGTASWTLKSYLGPKPGADGSGKTGSFCAESKSRSGTLEPCWNPGNCCWFAKLGYLGFNQKRVTICILSRNCLGDFDHVLFSSPFGVKICTDKRLWGSLRATISTLDHVVLRNLMTSLDVTRLCSRLWSIFEESSNTIVFELVCVSYFTHCICIATLEKMDKCFQNGINKWGFQRFFLFKGF